MLNPELGCSFDLGSPLGILYSTSPPKHPTRDAEAPLLTIFTLPLFAVGAPRRGLSRAMVPKKASSICIIELQTYKPRVNL